MDNQQKHALLNMLRQANQENALRALFTLLGISQKQVCMKYNIASSEISRVLAGKRKTRRVQEALAQEMGFPFDYLFAEFNSRKNHYE